MARAGVAAMRVVRSIACRFAVRRDGAGIVVPQRHAQTRRYCRYALDGHSKREREGNQ
jgi:hypothetical protein